MMARLSHFLSASGVSSKRIEEGLEEIRAWSNAADRETRPVALPERDETGRFRSTGKPRKRKLSKAELVRIYCNKLRILEWLVLCTGQQVGVVYRLQPTKPRKGSNGYGDRVAIRLDVLEDVLLHFAEKGVARPSAVNIAAEMSLLLDEPIARELLYQEPYRQHWFNLEATVTLERQGERHEEW